MRLLAGAVVAIIGMAAAGQARAQTGDYPFTGFFADAAVDEPAETTAARCALAFFEQRIDGSYIYYHLDRQAFEAEHKVAFIEYARGNCTFDPGRKIEICNSKADLSNPEDQAYSNFAVYSRVTPDVIAYSSYGSIDEAKAAVASGDVADAEEQGEYRRCPTDAEKIRSLIAPGVSGYPADDIAALADPDEALLGSTLAGEVVRALQAK